ncbi:MAG TPA: phage baseplate assembly protein V [Pyrinomonadaceae bacterium]|nr:phage baseplate assembly protein V [Pyrinomonadaceae bacterium]
MNLFDVLSVDDKASATRISGVVVGVVTNNQDPAGLGRVKVKFPWLSDSEESFWARVAMPMAGKGRGFCFLPEVEDEVLIAFEHGDARFPYVVGALWNGQDKPPEADALDRRVLKSVTGHAVVLDDTKDQEKIEIIDKSGKNTIVIDTVKNTITITSDKDITLSASKGTIKLEAQKIEIKSSADTAIEAGAGMDVKATGTMNVKGAMVNIN